MDEYHESPTLPSPGEDDESTACPPATAPPMDRPGEAALVLVVICRPDAEPLVARMCWPSFREERLYALFVASHARRQVVACGKRTPRW